MADWQTDLDAGSLRRLDRESIAEEARRLAEAPVGCPRCGAVLEIRADGVRNCPTGDYRWRG